MSEASQVFIRTVNPIQFIKSDLDDYNQDKWKKVLGEGENTVLVHYHQWCYGVTLISAVHRMLAFHVKDRKHMGEFHPFMLYPELFISFGLTRRDFNEIFDPRCIDRYIEFYTFLLSINTAPWKYGRGYGLEAFRFINADEPKVRHDYKKAYEDNGICIIDAITQKYAFLNKSKYGFGYINLPMNTPLSAREYAHSFYPDKRGIFRDSMRDIEHDEVFDRNAKVLKYVENKFRKFKVLTMAEIADIFPQMNFNLKIKKQ